MYDDLYLAFNLMLDEKKAFLYFTKWKEGRITH